MALVEVVFFGALVWANALPAAVLDFAPVDHLCGSARSEYCNLRSGPGVMHIRADMLGGHNVIGAAIGLAGNDGDQRHSGLAVGK